MKDSKVDVGLSPELSLVIPVFNAESTIAAVVAEIRAVFAGREYEIVLVNDGSADGSDEVCRALAAENSTLITYVQLARNFGEHNAVLAGLSHATGAHAAVLDDDGQHDPVDVARMLDALRAGGHDVVFGRYRAKHHGWLQNLGSWFNDRMANRMLGKPRELYLSSFKVMTRFVIDEVIRYRGPYPYIDGLIYRTTRRLAQIDVSHRERLHGRTNYDLHRLVRLWLNMFMNFSILPLRVASVLGLGVASSSVLLLLLIVIDKLWVNPEVPFGVPTILVTIVLFAGLQLLILGTIGEYLGRLYLDVTGTPQFIVRHAERRREPTGG